MGRRKRSGRYRKRRDFPLARLSLIAAAAGLSVAVLLIIHIVGVSLKPPFYVNIKGYMNNSVTFDVSTAADN